MEKPNPLEKSAILKAMLEKFKESLLSVMPVSLLVFVLSITPWVDISPKELLIFVAGAFLLVIGIGLFNLGADMAMTPMGQYIGQGLTASKKMGILLSVGFAMGLLITIAEPDLTVLADQVKAVMNGTLLIGTVGVGVGILLLIGVVKIVFHIDLTNLLLFFYMLLFCLAALLIDQGKGSLMAMSFDSGGVTTGPITVPFIMALGVGIALTVGGRNASENSFGLIALCSVGPILAVLALELILSVASIKLLGVRRLLCGRPVILVEHGRISAENLRRTRVTLDELTGRLREQGILDPATVNYAILETNGQLSVFPYAKYRPASAMDAGIEARDESLPVTVIADGRILRDNLRLTGRDRTWLDGCLRAQKCRRKDVLLLTVDGSGVVHMQRKGTRK